MHVSMHFMYVCYILLMKSYSVMYNSLGPQGLHQQDFMSFTISQSLIKLMSMELVMPLNHLTLRYHFLFMPAIFTSIRVFSNESALCIRWPKYWSFSSSPSNEYSGLISFRIDSFNFVAIQETLKSLL